MKHVAEELPWLKRFEQRLAERDAGAWPTEEPPAPPTREQLDEAFNRSPFTGVAPFRRMHAMSFDTWQGRLPPQLTEWMEAQLAGEAPDPRCLLFVGPHGSGKTHLGVACLRELSHFRRRVFFQLAPSLTDDLASEFNSAAPRDRWPRLVRSGVLLLDDVGLESGRYGENRLSVLVVERHAACLPTIVTTNRLLPNLHEADPRTWSRLREDAFVVEFDADLPDYRLRRRNP